MSKAWLSAKGTLPTDRKTDLTFTAASNLNFYTNSKWDRCYCAEPGALVGHLAAKNDRNWQST